jgi:NADP-dependent 3-hydroxy acid dehydrogenase YdfG
MTKLITKSQLPKYRPTSSANKVMGSTPIQELAIVIGAGPGTGAAIGRAFAQKGFHVALLARSKASLETLAQSITDSGGKVQTSNNMNQPFKIESV